MNCVKRFLLKNTKTRVIETAINTQQFKDHIEGYLRMITILRDKEDIIDIAFPGSEDQSLPLKIYIRKEAKK